MDKLILLLTAASGISWLGIATAQGSTNNGISKLSDARDHLGAMAGFIEDKKANFAIQNRKVDMFGLSQDPKKEKAILERKKVEVAKTKPAIPLQKILDALPVTMIDPLGDRVILRGVPPLRVGETIELAFQGETVLLQFEGSRSTGAYFRDTKTKKLGLRKMTKLPKGVKRGIVERNIADQGIHRDEPGQSQTIKVDLNLNQGFTSD